MSFFNWKPKDEDDYIPYSTHKDDINVHSDEDYDDDEEDEECEEDEEDFGDIKFLKELSNGALIFRIVDEDYDPAGGYVIVSPSGNIEIIKDNFFDALGDKEKKYLETQALTFWHATRNI